MAVYAEIALALRSSSGEKGTFEFAGKERTWLEGWGRGGRLPYFETCVSEWARTESGALEMHASTVACIRCTSLGLTQRSIKMGVWRRVCLHMRLACACAQVRKREEGPAYTSLLCGFAGIYLQPWELGIEIEVMSGTVSEIS